MRASAALISHMRSSTASFIIRCMSLRAPSRAGGARVCARHRRAMKHARGARRRHSILEYASPILGSGLVKIGQAGDPGIVTSPGPRGPAPGTPGDAGCRALLWPGGVWRGALFSAPPRPCQPCARALALMLRRAAGPDPV